MDIITQRFIAMGNRLLAELRRLSDSIQQHEDATREESQARNRQDRPTPEVRAILDAPQGIETRKSSSDTQNERHYQNRTLFVQWVLCVATIRAFVAAAVYAGVAHRTYKEIKRQTNSVRDAADAAKSAADTAKNSLRQSIESFRVDERAWVEIEPIKPVMISQADAKFPTGFTCSIYPKNVGKTVATNIVVKAQPLGAAQQFSAEQMRNVQDKFLLDKFKESGTNKPVVVPSNPVPKVLSPNTIANAPFTLGCQAIKAYPSGDGWYDFIVGRIDYCDAFHVRHWKTFCFFVAFRGEVWNCQEGNEEDNNPEIDPTEKCTK